MPVMLFLKFIAQFKHEEMMMDTLMERSNYVRAFQQQLNDEAARAQAWPWRTPAPGPDWARNGVLRDGTAVTLRPVQHDDLRLLWEMHQRVSAASLYYRYLHAYTPSLADLVQISDITDEVGGALVATTRGSRRQIIALAYYLREKRRPDTAGVAFLVEDRYQGRGLGHMLLQELSDYARDRGVIAFEASVHPANTAMLRIMNKSGLPLRRKMSFGLQEIELQLKAATPEPSVDPSSLSEKVLIAR
jgi:GNAT superfamily N-acetyltransferase